MVYPFIDKMDIVLKITPLVRGYENNFKG